MTFRVQPLWRSLLSWEASSFWDARQACGMRALDIFTHHRLLRLNRPHCTDLLTDLKGRRLLQSLPGKNAYQQVSAAAYRSATIIPWRWFSQSRQRQLDADACPEHSREPRDRTLLLLLLLLILLLLLLLLLILLFFFNSVIILKHRDKRIIISRKRPLRKEAGVPASSILVTNSKGPGSTVLV